MAALDVGEGARIGKRRRNEALIGHPGGDTSLTASTHERVPFGCECGDADCIEMVWMVGSQFWKVVDAGGFSIVAPGHLAGDERIVARTDSYLLVVPARE